MVGSASFDEMVFDLAYRDQTPDPPRAESSQQLIIGWGCKDRICWPRQAELALKHFPEAQLTWFKQGGHMLHWDLPDEIARFILQATND